MQSIRRKLTLSYAAIALLATAILGAVLLGVLNGKYSSAEREYMAVNAGLIADEIEHSPELPDEARSAQVRIYSFLTQTRVRLLDGGGKTVADSGPPTVQLGDAVSARTMRARRSAVGTQSAPVGTGLVVTSGVLPPMAAPVDPSVEPTAFLSSVVGPVSGFVGFGLGIEGDGVARSSEVARVQYDSGQGAPFTVELSLGPDFGSEIMRATAMAWSIASAVAVLLAALAGGLVSRRISAPVIALTDATRRMADGDLAARATPAGHDEMGVLAHSFNEMAEQVEDTVGTLRRFVGDAAHQLNTPLTALRANLELLGRPDAPPETADRAFGQVQRLERLTRDMLDLSRIEAGGRRREPVDLVAVLRETVDAFASRAEQASIELSLSLPDGAAMVTADRAQLFDAFSNLIDNALKFTSEDGKVAVSLATEGSSFVVSVADTGIGIPETDMPQLFSRFHRGRNVADYGGSGLGLAIVKAIVDAHDGDVEATSSSSGTKMSVRLPRSGERIRLE